MGKRPKQPAESATTPPQAYNPLDKWTIGDGIVRALLATPCHPVPPPGPFPGVGIYLLYYTGKHELYSRLAQLNAKKCVHPIYVGRAQPKGGRKGAKRTAEEKESPLYARLRHHANSISSSPDLDIKDFQCRYLLIDELWVPLAERLLISAH